MTEPTKTREGLLIDHTAARQRRDSSPLGSHGVPRRARGARPGSRSRSPGSSGPRRRPASDPADAHAPAPPTPMSDRRVRIYEVGPRDGLQNEATPIATADKLRFLDLLAAAGLREIEATSFVRRRPSPSSPTRTSSSRSLTRRPGVRYPVLVPNLRGLERAEAAGADAIAVFTAASSPSPNATSA